MVEHPSLQTDNDMSSAPRAMHWLAAGTDDNESWERRKAGGLGQAGFSPNFFLAGKRFTNGTVSTVCTVKHFDILYVGIHRNRKSIPNNNWNHIVYMNSFNDSHMYE
jgi:hypothetical protein